MKYVSLLALSIVLTACGTAPAPAPQVGQGAPTVSASSTVPTPVTNLAPGMHAYHLVLSGIGATWHLRTQYASAPGLDNMNLSDTSGIIATNDAHTVDIIGATMTAWIEVLPAVGTRFDFKIYKDSVLIKDSNPTLAPTVSGFDLNYGAL